MRYPIAWSTSIWSTSLLLASAMFAQNTGQDAILRAMKDEMARAKSLRVVGDPPYFVEYTLDDAVLYMVSASYGALTTERTNHVRHPRVRIRVGDPKLDNSNHVYSDSYRGSRYDPSQFVLDDNYETLRLGFWLATDRAYKQALEALARKKASLKNINVTEQLPDFSATPPLSMIQPALRKPVDGAAWREKVKSISAVFAKYPEVLSVDAAVNLSQTTSYYMNNEGTEARYPDNMAYLRIRAQGIASDGSPVRDFAEFLAEEPSGFPASDQLHSAATKIAENIQAMAKAPMLDSYSGPVIFEGVAGAQIVAELLARNLTYHRRPITDPDRPINLPTGELEGRLGSRILPDFINVVDDPTQRAWQGTQLAGFYALDMDGVAPKPLVMVEKGTLKTYYSTRQPLLGVEASNGHARLPGALGNNSALAGNLFFKSSQPVPAAELKQKLLDMCKQRSKPFGILVRKMDFPSTAQIDEIRRIAGGSQGRAISKPLLIFKVYPDGREELVRGVRFRSFNVRSLKDIQAASDELYTFSYMENGAPFAHMDLGGYVAGTSVVAPALLFDDLELEKIPGELPKPPIVAPPPLTQ